MKLIDLTCNKCGAQLKVNAELSKCMCQYCGNEMLIDQEVIHHKIDNAFDAGYQAELGRIKAQKDYELYQHRKQYEALQINRNIINANNEKERKRAEEYSKKQQEKYQEIRKKYQEIRIKQKPYIMGLMVSIILEVLLCIIIQDSLMCIAAFSLMSVPIIIFTCGYLLCEYGIFKSLFDSFILTTVIHLVVGTALYTFGIIK